ncbi:MAG: S41 family peptidase [Treponema sp.]|jgi:hypothetical protein|nr:S41 family peptidase [Treponema sp.]
MKIKFAKKFTALFIIFIITLVLSTCTLFLGPDPDDSPRGIFETVWNDFNRTYALFDHKGINWNAIYNEYSPRITQDMTPVQLYIELHNMLAELNDEHVGIGDGGFFDYMDADNYWDDVTGEYYSRYGDEIGQYLNIIDRSNEDNFQPYYAHNFYLEDSVQGNMSYGKFKSDFSQGYNIGYIHISDFWETSSIFLETGDWAKEIDSIISRFSNTDGLILDMRDNNGGMPSNYQHIASRFAAIEANYMTVRTKNGPGRNDFTAPYTRTLKPEGTTYTKPVIMLTNNWTASCGEMFTLALRSQPHVTHAGTNTRGIISIRILRPLINGWGYTVSVQQTADMAGICHEAKKVFDANTGIPPKVSILTDYIWSNNYTELEDAQLEGALDLLINKF